MTKQKLLVLFSFLVSSMMIGNSSIYANLEITPSPEVQEVQESRDADTKDKNSEPAPEAKDDTEQLTPAAADKDDLDEIAEEGEKTAKDEEDMPEADAESKAQADEKKESDGAELPETQESQEGSDKQQGDKESESTPEAEVELSAPALDKEDGSGAVKETEEKSEESLTEDPASSEDESTDESPAEDPKPLPDDSLEEKSSPLSFGLLFDVEFGDMTYTIQGPEDGGWKSELEWPLDSVMYAGAEASVNFRKKWRIHAEFLKSVTDDAGTMKDSDWFYGYYGDRVAVYSETSTTVDAYNLDMSLHYRFLQKTRFSFGGLLGYAYKHWDWTGGDGYQWTIDPFSHYQGPIKGPAISYKEDLYIPYLGLDLAFLSGNTKVEAELSALYSPFAVCKDESDHLLREKKGEGDTSGNFFALRGNARWNLNAHWSLGARASISHFDLKGDQTQYFYGGDNAGTGVSGIDMSVKGTQSYLGLMLGYSL